MDISTLDRIDEDLEQALKDATPPPVCEWDRPGCDQPAAVAMLVSCGCVTYYCTPHGVAVKARLDGPGVNVCTIHEVRVTLEWRAL